MYDATFDAYTNVIDMCIAEKADALLVAGDIYDGVDRSLHAQMQFVEGLRRLDAEGIRSFVCHGNHDPLDRWEARLDYPPSCHRFGSEFEERYLCFQISQNVSLCTASVTARVMSMRT